MNGARTCEGQWAWQAKGGRQANKACRTGTAGKHSLLNKATAGNSASGFSARLRPQNKRPTVGRWCSKNNQPQMTFPLAVQVGGGSAVVLALKKTGSDLPKPVPSPPNAFACHCPYPLP